MSTACPAANEIIGAGRVAATTSSLNRLREGRTEEADIPEHENEWVVP
jgi:hypothetical protein